MKRRSKKSNTSLFILAAVAVGAGAWLLTKKSQASAAAQGEAAGQQLAAASAAAAQFQATRGHIVDALKADGVTLADAQIDMLTNAYLRGDPTELAADVNYMHSLSATQTAAILTDRLGQNTPL